MSTCINRVLSHNNGSVLFMEKVTNIPCSRCSYFNKCFACVVKSGSTKRDLFRPSYKTELFSKETNYYLRHSRPKSTMETAEKTKPLGRPVQYLLKFSHKVEKYVTLFKESNCLLFYY